MTVKARDDVTLANVNDVTASIRYYQLKASTASAPTAPTVYPAPSPWVTAEPSYSDGATNSLYTVDVTVFSDGSFDYSLVSLSSSYEAAKSAWNKAQAAQTSATSAQTTANLALANAQEMVINGTGSSLSNTWGNNGVTTDGTVFSRNFPGNENHVDMLWGSLTSIPIQGHIYQISIDARVTSGTFNNNFQFLVTGSWKGVACTNVTSDWKTFTSTYTASGNDTAGWILISFVTGSAVTVQMRNLSVKDITAAAQAQYAANTAQSTADSATTIANAAKSAASTAQSAADAAHTAANAAQTTADGKNSVTRSTSAPSSTNGYKTGDQWWVYSGGTVTALYLFSGTAWVSQTLTNSVIANLDAGKITAGYISADRINDGSITGAKITAGTITASNMVAGTLTAASGIIADAAIGSAQIIDGSIGSAEIANAAVGTAKIADAAISTAKIADAAVNNAKISSLDAGKITSGYVDAARIQSGTIDADKLAAGSVTSDKIVADAVTSDKLVANAVTADKIAANSVTADKILAGTITSDKVAAGQFTGYVFTGAVFQSSEAADTGIKINSTALQMWDSNHNRTVYLDGEGQNNVLTGSFQTAATGNRVKIDSQATSTIIGGSTSLSGQSIIFQADNFAASPSIYGYSTSSDVGDAPDLTLHSGWKTDHDPAATLYLQSLPRSQGATGSGITSRALISANTDYTEPDSTKKSYASLDLEGIGGSGAYASLEAHAYAGSEAKVWVTASRNDGFTLVGISADAFTQRIYLGGKLGGITNQQTFQTSIWKAYSGTTAAGGTLNPVTVGLSPAKYGVYYAVANADVNWGSIFIHVCNTGSPSQYQVMGYNAGSAYTGDIYVDTIAWLT